MAGRSIWWRELKSISATKDERSRRKWSERGRGSNKTERRLFWNRTSGYKLTLRRHESVGKIHVQFGWVGKGVCVCVDNLVNQVCVVVVFFSARGWTDFLLKSGCTRHLERNDEMSFIPFWHSQHRRRNPQYKQRLAWGSNEDRQQEIERREHRESVPAPAHLLDAGVVNEAGIGAGASNDDLGPEQLGRHLHLVIVYKSRCWLQGDGEENRLREEVEGDKDCVGKIGVNMGLLEVERGMRGENMHTEDQEPEFSLFIHSHCGSYFLRHLDNFKEQRFERKTFPYIISKKKI